MLGVDLEPEDVLLAWAEAQPAPKPVVQLSGEQLRDKGVKKVLSNNQDWKDSFNKAAGEILKDKGQVDAESVLDVVGFPNGHRNAVGAAMRVFAMKNKLHKASYVKCERPSRHAAVIAIWKPTS